MKIILNIVFTIIFLFIIRFIASYSLVVIFSPEYSPHTFVFVFAFLAGLFLLLSYPIKYLRFSMRLAMLVCLVIIGGAVFAAQSYKGIYYRFLADNDLYKSRISENDTHRAASVANLIKKSEGDAKEYTILLGMYLEVKSYRELDPAEIISSEDYTPGAEDVQKDFEEKLERALGNKGFKLNALEREFCYMINLVKLEDRFSNAKKLNAALAKQFEQTKEAYSRYPDLELNKKNDRCLQVVN